MTEDLQARPGSRRPPTAVIVLAAICLVSGLGVAALYQAMKSDIEENMARAFRQALQAVLGEADEYGTVGAYAQDVADEDKVYVCRDDGRTLYAARGEAKGYQSTVEVIVSVRADSPNGALAADPVIHAMAVFESGETPGLGENIRAVEKDVSVWGALAGARPAERRPWFQDQFSGKRLSDLVVETRKDTDRIAAVTGATRTSEATTLAVRNAVGRIIERTAEVYGR
ncbi:MAG: FMN-binding protein [Candidatus Brocadiaceae bacterium]|nr:FMN-binding protein [Candidatus Brocadiaceae bacterium]